MITVNVCGEERQLGYVDRQWISQQINRRRAGGEPVWVRVRISHGNLDLVLSTPGSGGAGGGRAPNRFEQAIFDIWRRLGLNDLSFTSGNVLEFLSQLKLKL